MWPMKYNDGFLMDENLRVTVCPKCGNEEFSERANFCRICGTSLYNFCDGEDIYDYDGNFDHHEEHRNCGNARFCEKCGKPTAFLNAKYLRPYTEVKGEYVKQYMQDNPNAFSHSTESFDDEELPF